MRRYLTNKRTIALLLLFIIVGVGSFAVTYSRNAGDQNVAYAEQCQGTCIALGKDRASPDTVAVTVGSFVQFNSADGKAHSLSLGEGGSGHDHHGKFSSGTFQADEGWRVQFNEEGTFRFHDHLNPDVNIIVVVYTPGKDYKIQN